jgi:hypothetical protein
VLDKLQQPFSRQIIEGNHHTLPTSSSSQVESQSFVHITPLKDRH